jgi:hypothetical protein
VVHVRPSSDVDEELLAKNERARLVGTNEAREVKEDMSNEQTDDGANKQADFDPLEDFDTGEDRYYEERPARSRSRA